MDNSYLEKVISLTKNGFCEEMFITAHRGVTAYAPENTLPAYQKSVELGYYTAECDIRLTKDGVWVLHHNGDLAMFGKEGTIEDHTYEELCSYKYVRGTNCDMEGLKICTLDEFLDVFVGTSTRPQIEIKTETYDTLGTVVDAVVKKGMAEQSIVISFDLEQLRIIHNLNPDIELWYLVGKITPECIAEAKALSDKVWLSPCYDDNDEDSIKLAVDAGIGVSFWTVDTVEDAKRLFNMGVKYIETDILCK